MEVRKRLSETEKAALLEALAPLAERQATLSRRAQAMLASAGLVAPERHWYVLLVHQGCDNLVDNMLANAGIERWMAAVSIEHKRRGGRKFQTFVPLVAPALPGYLFVRATWSPKTWEALRGIDGVAGVIGGPERPSPLKNKDVEKLRARAEKDPTFIALLINALKAGDAVRVDEGPFASFQGVISTLLAGSSRVKVEVDLFGRAVPLDLGVDQITKLE